MLWIWMCVDAGDLNAGRELPELRRRLTGVVPVSGPRTPLSQSRAGTQLSAEARPITGRQEAALILITLHHQHRGDHRTIHITHHLLEGEITIDLLSKYLLNLNIYCLK